MQKTNEKQKNMAIVIALAKTLKQGPIVNHCGVDVHSYATFTYNNSEYRISVNHQHVQRSTDQGITFTDVPVDSRSRESYMFYKTKEEMLRTGSSNRVITMSKYEFNVILLVPDAFNTYILNPEDYSVNHKSSFKQGLLEYECTQHLYLRYVEALNNHIPTVEDLEVIKNCTNSDDLEYVMLRAATNNLRNFPARLRYNDIANLELCTKEENTFHIQFVNRLKSLIPDAEAYMISYEFARKWCGYLYSRDPDDRIAIMNAAKILPKVESLV